MQRMILCLSAGLALCGCRGTYDPSAEPQAQSASTMRPLGGSSALGEAPPSNVPDPQASAAAPATKVGPEAPAEELSSGTSGEGLGLGGSGFGSLPGNQVWEAEAQAEAPPTE